MSVILRTHGLSLKDAGLPEVSAGLLFRTHLEGLEINIDESRQSAEAMYWKANQEQKLIINKIKNAIFSENTNRPNAFFIDGPGGTGMTFIYKYLIYFILGSGQTVKRTTNE